MVSKDRLYSYWYWTVDGFDVTMHTNDDDDHDTNDADLTMQRQVVMN